MSKEEFEKLIDKKVSGEDFDVIQFVYNFYPTISETNGKTEVAELYKKHGMGIFHDMYPTARRGMVLEDSIRRTEIALDTLKREYKEFREGKRDAK